MRYPVFVLSFDRIKPGVAIISNLVDIPDADILRQHFIELILKVILNHALDDVQMKKLLFRVDAFVGSSTANSVHFFP